MIERFAYRAAIRLHSCTVCSWPVLSDQTSGQPDGSAMNPKLWPRGIACMSSTTYTPACSAAATSRSSVAKPASASLLSSRWLKGMRAVVKPIARMAVKSAAVMNPARRSLRKPAARSGPTSVTRLSYIGVSASMPPPRTQPSHRR